MAIYTASSPAGFSGYYKIELTLRSQDKVVNTSTLNYRIYLESLNNGTHYSNTARKLDFTADGKTIVNTTSTYNMPAGGSQTLASGTFTVPHNLDGSKTFSFISNFSVIQGSFAISGQYTLPEIPRTATLSITNTSGTPISEAFVGSTIRFNINNKYAGYNYKIHAQASGYPVQTVYSGTASYYDFVIPASWNTTYLSDSAQRLIDFNLTTLDDSDFVGSDYVRLNIKASAGGITLSSPSIVEGNKLVTANLGNAFYQNLSQYRVSVIATPSSGATITNYSYDLNGKIYNSSASTVYLPAVNASGIIKLTVTVTDSRGQSQSISRNIEVLQYNSPSVFLSEITRNGGIATIRVTGRHTIASNTTDTNEAVISVKIRKGTEPFSEVYNATSRVQNFNEVITLGTTLDPLTAYDIEATITDKFNTYKAVGKLPTADISVVLDKQSNNVGIGKFPESILRNSLEVKGNIYTDGYFYGKIPQLEESINIVDEISSYKSKKLDYSNGVRIICSTQVLSATERNFSTGSAGFYGAKTVNLYYDYAFLTDDVVVSVEVNSPGFVVASVGDVYSNYCSVRLFSPNLATATQLSGAYLSVIAIGRWK